MMFFFLNIKSKIIWIKNLNPIQKEFSTLKFVSCPEAANMLNCKANERGLLLFDFTEMLAQLNFARKSYLSLFAPLIWFNFVIKTFKVTWKVSDIIEKKVYSVWEVNNDVIVIIIFLCPCGLRQRPLLIFFIPFSAEPLFLSCSCYLSSIMFLSLSWFVLPYLPKFVLLYLPYSWVPFCPNFTNSI